MEKFTSEDYPSIVQDLAKDLSKVLNKIGDDDARKKFAEDMTEHLISLNDRANRAEMRGRTISSVKAYQEAHFAASFVVNSYRNKEWFPQCHNELKKLDQKN